MSENPELRGEGQRKEGRNERTINQKEKEGEGKNELERRTGMKGRLMKTGNGESERRKILGR